MPFSSEKLQALREQHLYRHRTVIDSPQGVEIRTQGQRFLNFCSNDYLGLANHPRLITALQQGAVQHGVGSGASHLVNGHSHIHHRLEEELADFVGCEATLLFSTGYMANVGTISALLGRHDLILADKLNHASLIDGGSLSSAKTIRYPHGDAETVEGMLERYAMKKRKLMITDGVFSMDGDFAPLDKLPAIAKKHDGWLMVDDAHGLGVIGDNGGGVKEYFNLKEGEIDILVGTLGKAFGTFGAFVAGSRELIELLIQFARTYIYTTALPPSIAAATLESLKIVREEPWRRAKLNGLIAQFRQGAEALGLNVLPSESPIQSVIVGDSKTALEMSQQLEAKGIFVKAIRPPTVPPNTARLRVTFSSQHKPIHVTRLLDALAAQNTAS